MVYRITSLFFAAVVLTGCSVGLSSVEYASEHYKNHRDFASLETLVNSFHKGMQRSEVERLLGLPDYSPIEGQYYYSSDRSVYSDDQDREVTVGLVADYRDEKGEVTDRLQEFWLGPMGE
jgi:outer membrane protein assembly factor BamE (lipoprotein component of BamABCDE complex)